MIWLIPKARRALFKKSDNPDSELTYEKSYLNQDIAASDIIEATKSTKQLDILLVRGHTFISAENSLFEKMIESSKYLEKIRIVLFEPGEAMGGYLNAIGLDDTKKEEYVSKCKLVKGKLDTLKKKYRSLEYCYCRFAPTFKLIITDKTCFVAPYDRNRRGSEIPYARYPDMERPFYIAFSTLFAQLWKDNLEQI